VGGRRGPESLHLEHHRWYCIGDTALAPSDRGGLSHGTYASCQHSSGRRHRGSDDAATLLPWARDRRASQGAHLGAPLAGFSYPMGDASGSCAGDPSALEGGAQSHWGRHYTIENVRIHTPPQELPDILIAANGEQSAQVAGRIGDGLIGTIPETGLIQTFELAGGLGKPCYGKMSVCWARDEQEARRIAHTRRLTAGRDLSALDGTLPAPIIRAVTHVSEVDVAQALLCSADPARHIAVLREFAAAGYDHIYLRQIGPDQEGFLRFYRREVLSKFPS
jgi:coenzyme F420-dependent glucose-6-phosphate dehydrogenase